MYFTAQQLDELRQEQAEVGRKCEALLERLLVYGFRTEGGREHIHHGLARRLGTLTRCVEQVFALLPPDLEAIPERAVVVDATVNIQAFVMNAFGFCENVAWVWVHERGVTRPDGRPLVESQVGLGPKYERVRQTLTPGFRVYLDRREPWFAHLKHFRDALAHRIPLYIPPYTVCPNDADLFQALETASSQSLLAHDFDGYERLQREQMALARFQPIMTHSLTTNVMPIVFHPQLLADFNTLEELAGVLLDQLRS
ncbi:MAG: hypothetical protein HYU59_11885 [Magnetospirillum gryphiswaldense]|nr:hypothetical protein [Magnetospirillum gryphiswaldense]